MKSIKNSLLIIFLLVFGNKALGQSVVDNGRYRINITSHSIRTNDDTHKVQYSFSTEGRVFEEMHMERGGGDCDDIDAGSTYSTNGHVLTHRNGYINAVTPSNIELNIAISSHDGLFCSDYNWRYCDNTISLLGKIPFYNAEPTPYRLSICMYNHQRNSGVRG
jgi:hypothetical protein